MYIMEQFKSDPKLMSEFLSPNSRNWLSRGAAFPGMDYIDYVGNYIGTPIRTGIKRKWTSEARR